MFSTGKVICSVQEATEKDVDIAVDSARKVYDDYHGAWRTMTPQARGQLLQKLGELMYREIDTLAAVEALDNGKAFNIAKGDVAAAADCLKYYGGWSDKIHGKVVETDDFSFRYTRHESIGVCGQIIPWNFPLLMWSWKIGPAVATGNVVVLKTAEQTPLSALVAAKLIVEAGFPPGVINIISGFGKTAGAAIASHMSVDKVAFTGSTVTGRSIMKAAASSNLKKVTLELGGKSPTIVFNDADLDAAIDWANFGIYFNHGIPHPIPHFPFLRTILTFRTMLLCRISYLRPRRHLRQIRPKIHRKSQKERRRRPLQRKHNPRPPSL